MQKKFYITTPIYYASGNPHVGHAFTTVYADVLARYKRKIGYDVFFATGMDEHGSKIETAAIENNLSPLEYVNNLSERYANLWGALNISNDDFIRTSSERHKKNVISLMRKLLQTGDVYKDLYSGLYCDGCENFITSKELVNGLCPHHLKQPRVVEESNYFFSLKKYLSDIRKVITDGKLNIVPESRKKEVIEILKSSIPDFSISREKVKWGIPLPGAESQTIYVWVDALLNYISVLDFESDKYHKYWPPDLHLIGSEINKFHSVHWIALLLSLNLQFPKTICVHGLFTIDGQKMSKTLGNIIDPYDLIKKFGADATRYLLLSQFPVNEQGDIKVSEFVNKYNSGLANGVGNLVERINTLVRKFGVKITLQTDFTGLVEESILKAYNKAENAYKSHMDNYDLFNTIKDVFAFIKTVDIYIDQEKPWLKGKSEDKEFLEIMDSSVFALRSVLDWLDPFLPTKMATAKQKLFTTEKVNLFPRII